MEGSHYKLDGLQTLREQVASERRVQERLKSEGEDWLREIELRLLGTSMSPDARAPVHTQPSSTTAADVLAWNNVVIKVGGAMTEQELLMLSNETFEGIAQHYNVTDVAVLEGARRFRAVHMVAQSEEAVAARTSLSPPLSMSCPSYRDYEAALSPYASVDGLEGARTAVATRGDEDVARHASPEPALYNPHGHTSPLLAAVPPVLPLPVVERAVPTQTQHDWLAELRANLSSSAMHAAASALLAAEETKEEAAPEAAEEETTELPIEAVETKESVENSEEKEEEEPKEEADACDVQGDVEEEVSATPNKRLSDPERKGRKQKKVDESDKDTRPPWDSRIKKNAATGMSLELEKLRLRLDSEPPPQQPLARFALRKKKPEPKLHTPLAAMTTAAERAKERRPVFPEYTHKAVSRSTSLGNVTPRKSSNVRSHTTQVSRPRTVTPKAKRRTPSEKPKVQHPPLNLQPHTPMGASLQGVHASMVMSAAQRAMVGVPITVPTVHFIPPPPVMLPLPEIVSPQRLASPEPKPEPEFESEECKRARRRAAAVKSIMSPTIPVDVAGTADTRPLYVPTPPRLLY